eukprot:SAG31_NODE_531_length_14413_cov_7.712659_20_plen_55_part_00
MRYRMATYWVDGTTCAALEHRMYINFRLKNLSTTYPVRYLVTVETPSIIGRSSS